MWSSRHRRWPCVPRELNLGLAEWCGTRDVGNKMVLCERNHNIARNHKMFRFFWTPPEQKKSIGTKKRWQNRGVPQAILKTLYSYANKFNLHFWLTVWFVWEPCIDFGGENYSVLYSNSPRGYFTLKYLYSEIPVKTNWLPANTAAAYCIWSVI